MAQPAQMAMGGAGALRTSAEFASQAAKPDDKAPWAQRRDTLSYTLQLLSRNPEDAARKFTMSLAIATEEVGLAELPNIQLGMRALPSVHLQGALRKNASLKVGGVCRDRRGQTVGADAGSVRACGVGVFRRSGKNAALRFRGFSTEQRARTEAVVAAGPTRWEGVGAAPEMVHAGRRMLGPADCVVGSLINVMGTCYKVLSADAATHTFMEAFPEHFPASGPSHECFLAVRRCVKTQTAANRGWGQMAATCWHGCGRWLRQRAER